MGVHVRRGDLLHVNRAVPHLFYVEAVRAVLNGIAEVIYLFIWKILLETGAVHASIPRGVETPGIELCLVEI